MEGQIILIVGARGHGKTTRLRSITTKVHVDALILHDVSGQHKDYYKKPLLKFNDFTKAINEVENCMIALEEATIFVPHNPNPDIKEALVVSRYRGNTIVFVFHSLRLVPRYILDLCNTILLMKTNDNESFVNDKFERPEFTEVFKRVNASPDKYACEIFIIQQ